MVKSIKAQLWAVTRRNTVGPYREIGLYSSHDKAVDALKQVAKSFGKDYPYDGGDTYQVGTSTHSNIRYRIESREVEL